MDSTYRDLPSSKRIYLASDFHLGAPNYPESRKREDRIISWLESIESKAAAIFLLGDLFDFWFEYKRVVPKGYVRFQAKLADLADKGLPIHVFTGNHDLWMFDYFEKELGVITYHQPNSFQIGNNSFLIGHGDGLGPGDRKFKIIKRFFKNPFFQWGFKWIHPDIGIKIANKWSTKSRMDNDDEKFKGEGEWLWQYCEEVEEKEHHDFYVFGHRHLALEMKVGTNAKYFNLGEWIEGSHYLEIGEEQVKLKSFES